MLTRTNYQEWAMLI
jgi:hypothetical protein